MNRNAYAQIENRRKVENGRREMEQTVASERRAIQIATFEINTSKKIDLRMKQQRFEALMREQEKSLQQRRRQLGDLYSDEMENWTQEILSRVETNEEKKNKIKERAYALRETRRQEQQKIYEEKLEKQIKDGLDEYRTASSKKMTREVKNEVLKQIADKIQRKVRLSEEENSHVQLWKQERDQAESQEAAKEEARRIAQQTLVDGLKAQILEIQQRKQNYRTDKRRSDEEDIVQIRAALAREEADQKRRLDEGRQRGRDILQFNATNKSLKEEERMIQREQDQALLNYALYKEKEAAKAEDAKKQQNKRAAEEYRNYLKEQMIHEAEDTALVDHMRSMEEEKVWNTRDNVLKAREDARSQLMQSVHQGRQEQLSMKNQTKYQETKEESEWASKFIDEARQGVEQERRMALDRRNINMQNQSRLADQIRLREERQMLEKQEAYLADKIAQRNARLQTEKLQAMVDSVYK
eukprot:gene466-872_t